MQNSGNSFLASLLVEGAPAFGGGTILVGPGPPLDDAPRERRRNPYAETAGIVPTGLFSHPAETQQEPGS
jgi:hypothetical protein